MISGVVFAVVLLLWNLHPPNTQVVIILFGGAGEKKADDAWTDALDVIDFILW